MTARILPCPFCGDADPAIDEIEMDIWAVCCNECGAVGPHQSDDGVTNLGPKAIELWNKRAGPVPEETWQERAARGAA